jgi:hypothetical protein
MEQQSKELDLRNLDIVTEVADQGGMACVDDAEPFEVWTFTYN